MIHKFLNAKHWQMFVLTIGLPIFFQATIMVFMLLNFSIQEELDPFMMLNYMKFIPIIMGVLLFSLFGWYWSVAIGLQKKIPANVPMKVRRFKVLFFFPIAYMLILLIFLGVSMDFIFELDSNPDSVPDIGLIIAMFVIVLPLHLFSIYCTFYSVYFVAKTIKTVALQREVKFGEFIGEFFMIWFYPIGIWMIQPKINEMVEQ